MRINKHASKSVSSKLHSHTVQTKNNTWDMAGKVVRSTDNDASVTPGTSCRVCVCVR